MGKLSPGSKKLPESEEEFFSRSGISIKRLYTPEDISQTNYVEDMGYPGEYPFTRGIYPTMYRGRIWSQRQLVGLGAGQDGNRRLRDLISQGMTGISVVCDINLYWYEPDNPFVRDSLGKTGSVLTNLGDWESYFDGIPFAPRLSFTFACQNDFFEEVAKFRAARRLWARI